MLQTGRPRKYCTPECRRTSYRKKYIENAVGLRARALARHHSKRDELNQKMRDERQARPERQVAYKLKYLYGLTQADYQDLARLQGGRCALCRKAKPLRVDHDHTTGVVRGLLCQGCNLGLGALGDDLAGLERAIAYLIAAAEKAKTLSKQPAQVSP